MTKHWGPAFKDLKPFDIISFDSLLERTRDNMRFYNAEEYDKQRELGRAHIGIRSSNLNDPVLRYYHEKYNHPNCEVPTNSQIVLRQFDPTYIRDEYYTKENMKIFEGNTSNVNNRDGFIVSQFSSKSVEGYYLEAFRRNAITGNWIYLTIPYEIIYDKLRKSINSAPLDKAIQFIEVVEKTIGWEDLDAIQHLVNQYDEKYPNWNHDFPIKSFIQLKKDGILVPPAWHNPFLILSEGTHRITMTGFNGYDVPYLIPIPYHLKDKWHAISRDPIFLHQGKYQYLCVEVNRKTSKATYTFSDNQKAAVERNNRLDPKHFTKWKGLF